LEQIRQGDDALGGETGAEGRGTPVKMVAVIYRQSLDQDIRRLLKGIDVKDFTEAPKIFGIGDAGDAAHTFPGKGHTCMILSAMREDQAERVIGQLKEFRDDMATIQGTDKVPLRVFAFPCEEMF
jgi:hypothetical protein